MANDAARLSSIWLQFRSFQIGIPRDISLHVFPQINFLPKSITANDATAGLCRRQFHSFKIEIPEDMQAESLGLICTPHSADKPWKH